MRGLKGMRQWVAGFWCAASASLELGCASAPRGQAWLELRTAHFDLYTDLNEHAALDAARTFEEARAALMTVAWRGASDPRGRTEVAVFADEDRLNELAPRGFPLVSAARERFIATHWTDEHPAALPSYITRLVAFDLTYWFTPLQPTWYATGMASFLAGLEYDRVARRAVLGGIPPQMARTLKRPGLKALSAETLFAATDYDRTTAHDFQFASWLLVHYLVNHDAERFRLFQEDLSALHDWRDAWASRFPELGPVPLDTGLDEYLDGGRFDYISAEVITPPFSPRVRKLSLAESYGISSWIERRLGQDESSNRDAEMALQLEPRELNALRARHEGLRGKSHAAERLSIARQLVEAHPESGEAWLLLARSGDSDSERDGALEQAQRLIPDHPGVLQSLAKRALESGDAPAALSYTAVLIRRSAAAPDTISLHIRALAGSGQCGEARRVADSMLARLSRGCSLSNAGERVECRAYWGELFAEECGNGRREGEPPINVSVKQ